VPIYWFSWILHLEKIQGKTEKGEERIGFFCWG
jgi:hypothetical protein